MRWQMSEQGQELLQRGLCALQLPCDEATVGVFMQYLHELARWGKAYNLTSITEEQEVVTKHFLDSALYLSCLHGDDLSIADVGTGGGFPGVVMKILRPQLRLTLIEPVGKKTTFLRMLLRRLGIDEGVTVLTQRIEDVGDLAVDVAVSRAFCPALEFVERTRHIVRPGGRFILSKGPRAQQEAQELEDRGLHATLVESTIPGTDLTRILMTVEA